MIIFTKTFTVINEDGNNGIRTFDHTFRKMDDKMFEHYKQNPYGMDVSIREHFKIPDNRYYTVSMWPENEFTGVVNVITNITRVVTATKISKSNQST